MAAYCGRSTWSLEARLVGDVLLYQTTDAQFIDRAIEEFEAAGIPCYKTGTGWTDMRYGRRLWADPVSLFLRRPEDYERANTMLLKMGAVADEPLSSSSRHLIWLALGLVVAGAIFIASHWSPS